MPNIIISNCWSFYNKGDAAIAIASTQLIHHIFPEYDITLLAVDDESFREHRESFGFPLKILPMIHVTFPFNKFRRIYSAVLYVSGKYLPQVGFAYMLYQLVFLKIFRRLSEETRTVLDEIDRADLIVAVGGNYLWSNEGFYNHLIPLVYAKFLKKKKVVLLGHSIGPFKDGLDKKVAEAFLKRVDRIIFRELVSRDYIKENIYDPRNSIVLSDYAFLLRSSKRKKLEGTPTIAFTIRKWLKNQPVLFRRYITSIIDLIDNLSAQGYKIYILPFSYLPGQEDDVEICNSVLDMLSTSQKENVKIVTLKELSPNDIVERFRELEIDILIGTRLHSTILSVIAGVPPIIISYQHFKAQGISQQLGLEDYVLKINEIDTESLLVKFSELLLNYELIKAGLESSLLDIRNELTEKTEIILNKFLD